MTGQIDPAAVMAEHKDHETIAGACRPVRVNVPWPIKPCEPYRLAEALATEQAKTARVAELAHRFEIVPRARLLGALAAKTKP